MANEDVTVFQSDFFSTSFAAFEDMRKTGHLCDLTIKVQNQSFSVHRVILAAGIPSFDSVFSGLQTEEKEFAVGENLDPNALESLINFAYTGKVNISSQNVQSLLEAAQFLQLNHVQNACLGFLSKKINSENVGKISTLAWALNNSGTMQSSNVYIRENFEQFSKREEFLNLSFGCIKEIISGDDLNVSSEEVVYEPLIRWIKFSPSDRQGMLPELLGEIRLTYLSVEYLMEQVESEELIMSSKGCRDLVKEVKYYHMMPERASGVSNLKTYPRNCLKKDLYAVCVCTGCGSSVHRYDSNEYKWHVLSSTENTCSVTTPIDWNNTVAVNGTVYVFSNRERIETLNMKTGESKSLPIRHMVYKGATFVPYGNIIYCFNYYHGLLCFDTQQNKIIKTEDAVKTQSYAAGAGLRNSIYVTGGVFLSNRVEKYTPATGEWSAVAPMLIKRSHHCCTGVNGKIYVCGNEMADGSKGEVYDPSADQWNLLAFLDSNSMYISLVSDHDNIYAFTENSGEVYDVRTRQWKSLKVPMCLKTVVSQGVTHNQITTGVRVKTEVE